MNFPRLFLLASLSAIALLGCGGGTKLSDGGTTDRVVCTEAVPTLAVKVVDAQGNPVKGATLKAKNLGTGNTVTGTTNDQGVSKAVTKDIGSGTVQLSATSGTLASDVAQVDWVCGECNCTATPTSVTLTLQ